MRERTPDEEEARIKEAARGLGRTQILVLRLLASVTYRDKTCGDLESDWPGLTESMVRNAIERLAHRGLVDVTGWHLSARTYGLTELGRAVEESLLEDFDEEEAYA